MLRVIRQLWVFSRFISEIQSSPAALGYRQSRHKRKNSGTCWLTPAWGTDLAILAKAMAGSAILLGIISKAPNRVVVLARDKLSAQSRLFLDTCDSKILTTREATCC